MFYLDWPEETISTNRTCTRWFEPGSNICLDLHGDPVKAQLVVFSDGNHHMALKDCLELFAGQHEDLTGIFYVTTPPGPVAQMLRSGGLQIGNLCISVAPHVFISPPSVLDMLVAEGFMLGHTPFFSNQGSVLLVGKGNPKHIRTVADLARADIRLFLSNPDTEKISYKAYYDTLKTIACEQDDDTCFPDDKIAKGQVLFGNAIHHREAPQAIAAGAADAAMVFYHLALRYVRIFPDLFDVVPLGGSFEKPEPVPGNVISKTHIGLVGNGGLWGRKLLSFLESKPAGERYRHHGLLPAAGIIP